MLWYAVSSFISFIYLLTSFLCFAVQVETLNLAHNALAGPAFPPAWLRPGAMPRLKFFNLIGNRGLRGTLPANLAWPVLEQL